METQMDVCVRGGGLKEQSWRALKSRCTSSCTAALASSKARHRTRRTEDTLCSASALAPSIKSDWAPQGASLQPLNQQAAPHAGGVLCVQADMESRSNMCGLA